MELEAYHFTLQVPFISNPVLHDQQLHENRGLANVESKLAFQSLGSAPVRLLVPSSTVECG